MISNLKRVLSSFELASGVKINLSKSIFARVGCSKELIHTLVDRLHCLFDHLPIKNLGLPIGVNLISIMLWDPIVEKFEEKLSLWKRN